MGKSSKANRRASANFLMFKDLECKEEFQKVRLAGLLRELHKLATEETKEIVKTTLLRATSLKSTRTMEAGDDEDGTFSLKDVDLENLSPEQAAAKIAALHNGEKLASSSLLNLMRETIHVLSREDTVIDFRDLDPQPERITVVGDMHGSLKCLMDVLNLVDVPELSRDGTNRVVVFNGDFVDRGDNSLEVITTLLLLKLSHPSRVFLIRGNHEDSMTASTYGFRDEVDEKYGYDIGEDIWHQVGRLFAALPIAARSSTAAIMHGGIPTEDFDLDTVNELSNYTRCELKTVVDPYDDDEQLVQGILWSDPSEELGLVFSERGAGYEFGPDVSLDFLSKHDLKYLIRSHEPCEAGTDFQEIVEGKGVVTVFSTANYPNGEGTNMGAILHLDDKNGKYETLSFKFSDGPPTQPYEAVLKAFVNDNRSKLAKAFRTVQSENGTVSRKQWCDVVSQALELPDVPWDELQPDLAPPTEAFGDEIDWTAFMDRVCTSGASTEKLGDNQLSLLHEHKDKFLNVFQLLDADGNGTVSLEEFSAGIELLNKEINADAAKMEDAEELFHAFDIDGDGELSIEEFVKALDTSATLKNITNKLDVSQVESLQQNHEMLLVAFKYLDTDRSGTIDSDEFQKGVDILNKRLGDRSSLGDPVELFNILDIDGSGDIDLQEFHQIFRSL